MGYQAEAPVEKQVALREANQRFAHYVRAVEQGEAFVITRRGKPVARLVPIEPGRRVLTPEQQAARQRRSSACSEGSISASGRAVRPRRAL